MTTNMLTKSIEPTPIESERSIESNAQEASWVVGGISIVLANTLGNLSRFVPVVNHAIDINKGFYAGAPEMLKITVINQDEEWRAAAKQYGHLEFAKGVTLDDGSVVVKSPEFACVEFARFERVVAHEVNHSFWVRNFGGAGAGWSPIWVVEGLANLVAPARDLLATIEIATAAKKRKLDVRALEYEYRDPSGPEELVFLYSLWRAVISDLSPNGDVTRLMQCLKSFVERPSEQAFQESFSNHFGKSLSDYFENFLELSAAA